MQTATYKGYTGKFEIDFEDNLISGIVIDIKDVIIFHGHTIEEALQCFHESVKNKYY
jgi:predicted HicB family RNase H-like nuclease